MIVYIEGKTLVKGVQSKDVYYIGTVEDDGYIYFNDKIAYRLPTPSNIQENVNVNLSDVQVLYPSRKAWVRANYFTELKCIGVDPKGIYSDLDGLDSRVADLESWRLVYVDPTLQDHGDRIANIEQWQADLMLLLGDIATYLHMYSVDANGNVTTGTYSDLAHWMAAVANHDRARQFERNSFDTRLDVVNNTLTRHQNEINANEDAIDLLNDHLGDFYNDLVVGSTYTTLSGWLGALRSNVTSLGNTVAGHTSDIATLQSNYSTLSGTVQQHGQAINGLRNDVSNLGGRTQDLENAIGTWAGGATTMAMAISGLIGAMGTLPSWAVNVGQALTTVDNNTTSKTNSLLRWVNELGHTSLGDGSSATWVGNGENLLKAINTINDIIDYLNQTALGVPSKINTSIYDNWTTVHF